MARENYKREVLGDEELDIVVGGCTMEIYGDVENLVRLGFKRPVDNSIGSLKAWVCETFRSLGINAALFEDGRHSYACNVYKDEFGNSLSRGDMWQKLFSNPSYYCNY